MDAIVDLCNSDSDESVSLPLLKHHESGGRAPSSLSVGLNPLNINVAEANVKYNYSPGTDECTSDDDDDSLLNSEGSSSLKYKSLQIRNITLGGTYKHKTSETTKSSKSRSNVLPCGRHEFSKLAEPDEKTVERNLDRKRSREIKYNSPKISVNEGNFLVELLDDTDDDESNSSYMDRCGSPSRKKLFSNIECSTKATLDSTSSEPSDDEEKITSSHPLTSRKHNDQNQLKRKCYESLVQSTNPRPSDVVYLLSSGDEGLSDLSPKSSLPLSKPSPIQTKFRSDQSTASSLGSTFDHNRPLIPAVAIGRNETIDLEPSGKPTDGVDLKKLSSGYVCDSDSDDSSLLSPSCFAREAKLTKDSTKAALTRPTQVRQNYTKTSATTSKLTTLSNNISTDLVHNITSPTPTGIRTEQSLDMQRGDVLNTPNIPMRRREKVPTPRIPMKGLGGKLYPDFRNQFIKALISHAKVTRRVIHQRGVLDSSIRAVNIFSTHRFPIRTAEAGSRLKGIGQELLSVLREAEKECKKKPYNPPRGKFSSVAASALVSLLEYGEQKPEETLCPMEELIARINCLTHHIGSGSVLNKNISYYLDKNTLDPGWMQVKKLGGNHVYAGLEAMIKERRKKDSCQSGIVFELMEHGRKTAVELRRTLEAGVVEAGPLRQLASDTVDEEFGNVTMSMDYREGGGNSKSLHKMCDLLDEYRVPYVVRNLKISDYVYFVGDKLVPILIERKSVDDVACSLADGRWKRQQLSMRKAQYVLGNGAERKCQICYLIEGDATRRTVHGGKVGRVSWNQTLKDVENAIAELPSLGFSVMKSRSHMGSMKILTQIARDCIWKYRNNSITCKYTYKEFLKEVKRCDDKEGDPPTLSEHQYPAAPVVDAVSLQANPSTNIERVANDSDVAGEHAETCSTDAQQKAEDLQKLSISSLKAMCKDRDEKVSGNKKELVKRLLSKRKPEILITRSRRSQYTPKIPSCNAAIIVALLLNHIPGTEGLSKEKIMLLAEETGVSKDPMGGNGGWYDGWASIKEMISGDPPLVHVSKRKYSLTTQPAGAAGIDVAKALHSLAHHQNICQCRQFVAI